MLPLLFAALPLPLLLVLALLLTALPLPPLLVLALLLTALPLPLLLVLALMMVVPLTALAGGRQEFAGGGAGGAVDGSGWFCISDGSISIGGNGGEPGFDSRLIEFIEPASMLDDNVSAPSTSEPMCIKTTSIRQRLQKLTNHYPIAVMTNRDLL